MSGRSNRAGASDLDVALEVERARAVQLHPVADEPADQLTATPRRLVREEGALARPFRPERHERTVRSTGHRILGDALRRCEVPADEVVRAVTGGGHHDPGPVQTGKDSFFAYQASRRGGELACRLAGDRVQLRGSCAFYLEGHIEL